jgi:hypothetical protein
MKTNPSSLGRWILCLTALVAAAVMAQTNPAAQQIVRFTVFAAEPIDDLGYLPAPGAAVVPLQFYPTARSPRYEHRGRLPLRLVTVGTGETVAEIPIPDGLREVLLLVSAPGGPPEPRRRDVTVLDDGPRQRGPGQIQILNLSGLELEAELNGRRIPAEAGLNGAVNAGQSARIILHTAFRGRSYLSWHDAVPLGSTGRALVVLFPPFLRGSLEVQTRVLLDTTSAAER